MSNDTTIHRYAQPEPFDGDSVAQIIQAAREHATPVTIDPAVNERKAFVVPAGAGLVVVDPDEQQLERPRRLKGSVQVETTESFKAYVSEFYDASETTAWVNLDSNRVVAVINDAANGDAAWRDHRATLQLVATPEWQRWRQRDGEIGSQEAFARHIEISEPDIQDPTAAELLELAQTFHATTSAEYRSSVRLSSGEVQLAYIEDTNATAGKNRDITIPKEFGLLIAPFRGEAAVPVTALLRYRVRDGKLAIGYELVRPDDVESLVMQNIAEQLHGDIARVYFGSPASA